MYNILRVSTKNCYEHLGGCSHVCAIKTYDSNLQKFIITDKLMTSTEIAINITKLFGPEQVPLHIRDQVKRNINVI